MSEYTPAELILKMTDRDVLRVSFRRDISGRDKCVDLYIWICPKTHFYKGLNVVAGEQLSALSDAPLNSTQLIRKIDATGYEAGHDVSLTLLSDIDPSDLQRLFRLSSV